MSPEAYVVIEYRLKDNSGESQSLPIDPHATQILGVFDSAAEAVRWVQKTFEETAGAKRQFADAEKLALFNVLVATDPFIENAYTPIVIPLMAGKVIQVLAGRMLGGLAMRMGRLATG
ncbi:MAG: hypothetical protein ABSF50_23020 [Burkholderiaceae bacterium]|jgi:hypothetical protein